MRVRRLLLPLAVAVAITAASLLPGAHAPAAGGLRWDLLLHATGGAALVLAGAWAVRRRDARSLAAHRGRFRTLPVGAPPGRVLLALAVAATLLGVGIEAAQSLVPSRDPSALDALADAAGAALAALAVRLSASRDP
ncbi:MAG: hypothetical protein ABEJ80_09670 [Halarchaeum sp.]